MPATQEDQITRYLEDTVVAERGMASQLQELASDGDDEEVRSLLLEAASQALSRAGFLTAQLNGSGPSGLKAAAAGVFASFSRVAQIGHIEEERVVQNLVTGYSLQMSGCAMYHALHAAASGAGHTATAQFAAEAIETNRKQGEKLFHLISTRAIIAYNMLTITEIDPAVETKYGEGSWAG